MKSVPVDPHLNGRSFAGTDANLALASATGLLKALILIFYI